VSKLMCPIPLTEDFIPFGRKNRPALPLLAEFITVHDTANPAKGADAAAHAAYLKGDKAASLPVSWHFTVDDQGAVQHLPLNEIGWHAGDGRGPGNMKSIGVEICENADGDRIKAEENAVLLVAWLLVTLNLPADRVVPHRRWTKTECPHILWPKWGQFIDRVKITKYQLRPEPWDPEMEIRILRKKGIINSNHQPGDRVSWGELATIINRITK